MAKNLGRIARGTTPEVSQDKVLRELAELAADEEVDVALAAIESMAGLCDWMKPSARKERLIPAMSLLPDLLRGNYRALTITLVPAILTKARPRTGRPHAVLLVLLTLSRTDDDWECAQRRRAASLLWRRLSSMVLHARAAARSNPPPFHPRPLCPVRR